ncbi:MAG: cation:proton antiporter [Spirochaetota bacterium]
MQDLLRNLDIQIPFEDPVLVFGFIMLLILLSPLAARRIRLPEIVGLIAAGIVFGPYGLGVLARSESVQLLGYVGLLYIMFQAGLEIDLHQVRRNLSHSIAFGLITFGVPLLMGTVLGMSAYGMSFAVAVLLASMFSSHTLLTFPVIAKLGLAKSPPVTSAIGGTIITDTLALLVLAIVAATAEGDLTPGFWIQLFATMAVYVVAVLLIAPRIGRWFLKRPNGDENLEFVFVLATVVLSGYLAYVAGLEPIIGAFLVGLCLNPLIPDRSVLMTRIHFTGDAIFIPFFLLSVGMLVDVRLLFSDLYTWAVAIGMILVALISKLIAAMVSGKILGYTRVEGGLLYGLSVNQAAATLAAVLVGYNIELFDDAVVTGTILMIAVTCFVGPIVTERFGRRVAEAEAQRPHSLETLPQRILIPISRREDARHLLDLAMLLRQQATEESVYPVSITEEGGDVESGVAAGERLLAHTVVRAMTAGIPVTPLTNVDLNVGAGIVRTARENRVPLILAGWDGAFSGRSKIFGRVLDTVADRTNRTLMVNRISVSVASARRMQLLLPPLSDREPGFDLAISLVLRLAAAASVSVVVHASADMLVRCSTLFSPSKDGPDVKTLPYTSWKSLINGFDAQVNDNDWIVLISARPGEVAWQPSLNRIPNELASRFPDNNLTFILPGKPSDVSGGPPQTQPQDDVLQVAFTEGSPFRSERTLLSLEERSINRVIVRLLETVEWESESTKQYLVDLLSRYSQNEAVELMEGVVLLHAHVPAVDSTVVMLGSLATPVHLQGITSAVRVVIILLNPVDLPSEEHLQVLARIARAIRSPGFTDALESTAAQTDVPGP